MRCHKYRRAARTAAGQRMGSAKRAAIAGPRQALDATATRQGRAVGWSDAGSGWEQRQRARQVRSLVRGGGGVGKASRSAWRRPESVEAKRRFSGMAVAVAAITTHGGRPTGTPACPNPNHSRRFHCHGMALAPASVNAATPSGPPFYRSSTS